MINAINICAGKEIEDPINGILSEQTRRRYDFYAYTLLIAEDIEINREIMTAILEESGVSIDFAENGKNAVAMYKENPDRYNLILMDINMPEMDGYEATRQIRALDLARAKSVPIVAMTANVFREDIEKCIESGMNDHTAKPIDADALLGMLNKYLTNPEHSGMMKNMYELEDGVAWNDSLLMGNALVDMQHQRIFDRVSELVLACEEGSDVEKLQNTLGFLVGHTVRHFADEEALQIEYNYPGYERHRQMHNDFKTTVSGLVEKFKENGSSAELSSNVNKIVVKWLVSHIKHEDIKIADHIRSVKLDTDIK